MTASSPTYRQQQAQATRDRIAAAARELFREQGYTATTVAAVSERAGIPVQTVYSALGSKARILLEVARLAVTALDAGDPEAVLAAPDAETGLRRAAALQRRQYEAMYDVVDIYTQAARGDHEIAAALAAIRGGREQQVRQHVGSIAQRLAAGVDEATALDLYLTLTLPEVFRTLVLERGWPGDRYERWLGDQLVAQLIG